MEVVMAVVGEISSNKNTITVPGDTEAELYITSSACSMIRIVQEQ